MPDATLLQAALRNSMSAAQVSEFAVDDPETRRALAVAFEAFEAQNRAKAATLQKIPMIKRLVGDRQFDLEQVAEDVILLHVYPEETRAPTTVSPPTASTSSSSAPSTADSCPSSSAAHSIKRVRIVRSPPSPLPVKTYRLRIKGSPHQQNDERDELAGLVERRL
ncbi:hypothetical protein JCM10213_007135 [Rhodosporidiobolus nylandii]